MSTNHSPSLAPLAYERRGEGPPLLLIHGMGHRRQMWQPIADRLDDRFDVVAVDLPGFGESERAAPDVEPGPEWLADQVEATMHVLGWPAAHVAGNSLGGWIALELARRGLARSVCALMPAGVWKEGKGSDSWRHRACFALWTTEPRLPGADTAIRNPVVRTVALFGLFGRPWRIPAGVAAGDSANLRNSDFARTMAATRGRRLTGGASITSPVTVVFGSRDPLIRRRETDFGQLPPQTTTVTRRGLGHVPTWDDPDFVASTIERTAGPRHALAGLSSLTPTTATPSSSPKHPAVGQ
jgi:pimeloyl-ACP methyl ester carboxylesterase